MAKIASTLILVVVFITVQGRPVTYDEILAAAQKSQWEQVQDLLENESDFPDDYLLHSNYDKNIAWQPEASISSVRNLKPIDGGHVYGEAEYSFHSASQIDGKVSEDHSGHKIINDNGKVDEFDFTPGTESGLIHPIVRSPQHIKHHAVNEYSDADYSFHYAPSSDGDSSNYDGKKAHKSHHSHHVSPPQLPFPTSSKTLLDETSQEDYSLEPDLADSQVEADNSLEISDINAKIQRAENFTGTTMIPFTRPLQVDNIESEAESVVESSIEETENNNTQTKTKMVTKYEITTSTGSTPVFRFAGKLNPPFSESNDEYSDFIDESAPANDEATEKSKADNANEHSTTEPGMREMPFSSRPAHHPKPLRTFNNYEDNDYIVKVASAIQDELKQLSQNIKQIIGNSKLNISRRTNNTQVTPLTFDSIRNLKKEQEAHVFGEQYAYQSASEINEETAEQRSGHKIIKDDGRVHEFDFNPATLKSILPQFALTNVRDLKPPKGGQVYGEAQYSYHSASNINGKTSEDRGGHKIINNNGKVKEYDFTPSPELSPVSFQ